MNLSEIRTKVRDEIKDSTTTFFSDAQINDYLNHALKELAKDAKVEADWTTNLVADTATYTLPTNCLQIQVVEVDADDDGTYEVYKPIPYKQVLEGRVTDGYWYVRDRVLTLLETPDAAVTDGLKIYGYKTPDTLSNDSDEHDLGSKYDWALVFYAVQQCYERRESWDKAAYYEKKYKDEKKTLMADRYLETDGGSTEQVEDTW